MRVLEEPSRDQPPPLGTRSTCRQLLSGEPRTPLCAGSEQLITKGSQSMSRVQATFVALTFVLLGAGAQTARAATAKNNTTVVSVQAYKDAFYLSLASGQSGENCAGGASVAIIPNTAAHPAFAQEVATV